MGHLRRISLFKKRCFQGLRMPAIPPFLIQYVYPRVPFPISKSWKLQQVAVALTKEIHKMYPTPLPSGKREGVKMKKWL